ncbi:MAG: hypothetical protein ACRDWE_03660, partial [Acidimicrobiales bacterium]
MDKPRAAVKKTTAKDAKVKEKSAVTSTSRTTAKPKGVPAAKIAAARRTPAAAKSATAGEKASPKASPAPAPKAVSRASASKSATTAKASEDRKAGAAHPKGGATKGGQGSAKAEPDTTVASSNGAAPSAAPTRAAAPIPYANDAKFLAEQRQLLESERAVYV